MIKSYAVLTAAVLLLAACGDGRDPGYVCMTNCAHYCADGISGDQCRRDIQLQNREQEKQSANDSAYYPDGGQGYYYGYGAPAAGGSTTTITTTTYQSY